QRVRPRQPHEVHIGDGFVVAHRLRDVHQAERDRDGKNRGENEAVLMRLGAPGLAKLVDDDHQAPYYMVGPLSAPWHLAPTSNDSLTSDRRAARRRAARP